TGSLNTAIRLTSISQFLTTTYGRTLAVKIELFLLMAAISVYHAFFLRPRLVAALAETTTTKKSQQPSTRPATVEQAEKVEARTLVGASRANDAAISARRAPRSNGSAKGAANGIGNGKANGNGKAQGNTPGAANGEAPGATKRNGNGLKPVEQPLSSRARSLEERIRDWLRREAVLGGAVLLCVALLGIFAGSLAPTVAPASGLAASGSSGAFVSKPQ